MKNEIIIYHAEEASTHLEVRIEDETVWLNRQQIADLFGRDVKTIGKHINNVFEENELIRNSTVANFATVQFEGSRKVERQIEHYNLDVIISVGYRVKSQESFCNKGTPIENAGSFSGLPKFESNYNPLASKNYSTSPYMYCVGNPVRLRLQPEPFLFLQALPVLNNIKINHSQFFFINFLLRNQKKIIFDLCKIGLAYCPQKMVNTKQNYEKN